METNKDDYRLFKAKEKVQKLKDFYTHITVMLLIAPVLVFINLQYSPGFYWFWVALGGMLFSVIIHWISTFGFGKDWEDRKIKELMNNDKKK